MAIALPYPTPAEWPDIDKLIAEHKQREAKQVEVFVARLLADRPATTPAQARPTTTDCPSKDG